MLLLKPNCELCDKDLPPDSSEACICSYECTFCKACVDNTLQNVCSNCGGGFVPRPIRPKIERRPGVSLNLHPPSTKRVYSKYNHDEIITFSNMVKGIKPEER